MNISKAVLFITGNTATIVELDKLYELVDKRPFNQCLVKQIKCRIPGREKVRTVAEIPAKILVSINHSISVAWRIIEIQIDERHILH